MYYFIKNSGWLWPYTNYAQNQQGGDNILDLMIMSIPTNINWTNILPIISYHDCCYTELDINPMKQKPRHIFLFNKADWDNFRKRMKEINKTLQNCYDENSANTLWCIFWDNIAKGSEMYIPSTMTTSNSLIAKTYITYAKRTEISRNTCAIPVKVQF